MREVRACDFCGEGAAGVFEVVPSEIDGDARRMVLCEPCSETLAGVVDPLLDALAGDQSTVDAGTVVAPASDEGRERPAAPRDSAEANSTSEPAEATASSENGETTAAPKPDGHEAGGRSVRDRKGTPRGYSKVMRFLEGREFPMERAAAEELVVEAYELDEATVERAIEHAKKHGRLREASGKLFR